MNKKELATGLNKIWLYATTMGIQQVYSSPSSIKASDEFKAISLDSKAQYEEVYLSGLRGSEYNILLTDYAYFQFSIGDDDEARYAYYPNPFLGASSEAVKELSLLRQMVSEGVMDFNDYLHSVSELRFSQHPPFVRYENAPAAYVNLKHPCSHIHFGHHGGNRWAVKRVLTPQAFGMLVLRHFYSEDWDSSGEVRIGEKMRSLDDVYADEKQDCRILPVDLFSGEEQNHFHFA